MMIHLPYTLSLRRIYIFPTRFGSLFIALLIAMLAGSVNYNNNLGFLLTFLLSSMGFVSLIHTYRNFSGIKIMSVRVAPVFAHETAVFEFHVRVDRCSRAAVKFEFPNEKGVESKELFVERDNRINVFKKTSKRGILRPGILNVSTIYPFGLFRAWSRLRLDLECPVYPRPIMEWFNPVKGGGRTNDNGCESGPGVDDFQGFSTYQPGDSPQHISWKAFSKGQGLLVKKFEGQTGSIAFFNWEELKSAGTERKLSILCGMILKASRMNMEYGLKLPGSIIEPGGSDIHKHRCLKTLSMYDHPSGL